MKFQVDYSKDGEHNCWSVAVTAYGDNAESNFLELHDYILKNTGKHRVGNNPKEYNNIDCCRCPWSEADPLYGEPEYGDNFTAEKDLMTKGEFMKEIRMHIRNFKKLKKNKK